MLNYTLVASIPPSMLSICSDTLPRPSIESLLYFSMTTWMVFTLFCALLAGFFEADRILKNTFINMTVPGAGKSNAKETGNVRYISAVIDVSFILCNVHSV